MPAKAEWIPISVAGLHANVPVTTLKGARFKSVVRQEHDFSCGSAAVATLLTYHYGIPTTERDVFNEMFEFGERDKIRAEGFSLLDIKRYFDRRAFRSDAFRAPLDKLRQAEVPAVVLVNTQGYMHFVVVKSMTEDAVLLGDPAAGITRMPIAEFEKAWNGIMFVLLEESATATAMFKDESQWQTKAVAPLGTALPLQSLASLMIQLPSPAAF